METKVKEPFKGVDYYLNKVIPKKFLVWTVATFAMFMGKVPGDLWAYISMVYLGVNVVGKFSKTSQDLINQYNGGEGK